MTRRIVAAALAVALVAGCGRATVTSAPSAPATYDGAVRTRDFTPLEPTVEENKYYARGVGPAQEIQRKGGTSVDKLLAFTPGR